MGSSMILTQDFVMTFRNKIQQTILYNYISHLDIELIAHPLQIYHCYLVYVPWIGATVGCSWMDILFHRCHNCMKTSWGSVWLPHGF